MIRWWRGETLMDTGNEGISDQMYSYSSVKKNQLTIDALGRYDQGAVYTCQASNSNLSAPVSASVTIEMFREYTRAQFCVRQERATAMYLAISGAQCLDFRDPQRAGTQERLKPICAVPRRVLPIFYIGSQFWGFFKFILI